MNGLAKRLKKAISDKGISQSELARRINVKPQSIQYLCSGKASGTTHAVSISIELGVSAHWLLTGEKKPPIELAIKDMDLMIERQGLFNEKHNIASKPSDLHQMPTLVPLISWVQAGSWSEVVDNFQPGDADEYYPCPEKHSENTFALTVIGESMSPDFIPGEIIYVDPCIEAGSGSCVVVRQNGDTEATFKQLMLDGSKQYLKALNPNWPSPIIEMLPDAVICGVVIGSYRKRN